mgnify:CR=1 FL=1
MKEKRTNNRSALLWLFKHTDCDWVEVYELPVGDRSRGIEDEEFVLSLSLRENVEVTVPIEIECDCVQCVGRAEVGDCTGLC